MKKIKNSINHYAEYYIIAVMMLWFGMLFVSWDQMLFGVSIYFFVMQKIFVILGLVTLLMSMIAKRKLLFLFGVLFLFAFWVNMFLLFFVLPPIFGN
ncbi:hypothetical protein DIX60_01695 [Streptococcus iniae]|uniref:Membrane protein n=1 Tax=Streptococcus iniae TaxID=1346 RepID=A0A1J0MXB3_STRIN|nr:hypothetical protein [Streptococcus iniae]AHY15189.1 membrane protein [Streptococcus iniae]AHY17060.1 membrane protein [Streptococcus iniae]AJG25375.1 membrane protein [Streptococcus iniae]APD31247.1 hypothetical protein BMF34_01720 [Streptococcus iniae]AYB02181.1 hypothetical protein D5R92_07235 [Streptococcus iniae]